MLTRHKINARRVGRPDAFLRPIPIVVRNFVSKNTNPPQKTKHLYNVNVARTGTLGFFVPRCSPANIHSTPFFGDGILAGTRLKQSSRCYSSKNISTSGGISTGTGTGSGSVIVNGSVERGLFKQYKRQVFLTEKRLYTASATKTARHQYSEDPLLTPKKIMEELDKCVIGQYKAKKILSVAVFNHYNRVRINNLNKQKKRLMQSYEQNGGAQESSEGMTGASVEGYNSQKPAAQTTGLGKKGKESGIKEAKNKEESSQQETTRTEQRKGDGIITGTGGAGGGVTRKKIGLGEHVDREKSKTKRGGGKNIARLVEAQLQQERQEDLGTVLEKSNVLLIGPTGSGKTLLAKTIAGILKVPFSMSDATPLTQAGYVGDDVETVIHRLLQRCDFNVEQAEYGIVFIDEIDKISKRTDTMSTSKDVSGEGVQQSLLRMLEGTVVTIVDKSAISILNNNSFNSPNGLNNPNNPVTGNPFGKGFTNFNGNSAGNPFGTSVNRPTNWGSNQGAGFDGDYKSNPIFSKSSNNNSNNNSANTIKNQFNGSNSSNFGSERGYKRDRNFTNSNSNYSSNSNSSNSSINTSVPGGLYTSHNSAVPPPAPTLKTNSQGTHMIHNSRSVGSGGNNGGAGNGPFGFGLGMGLGSGPNSTAPFPPLPLSNRSGVFNVDTSNILFILSGAFIGLEKQITNRISKGSIGFNNPVGQKVLLQQYQEEQQPQQQGQQLKNDMEQVQQQKQIGLPDGGSDSDYNVLDFVEPEDLIKYGFIPEFIGRIPVVASVAELKLEELIRILTEPKNSIYSQYRELFAVNNIELIITNCAFQEIAKLAIKKKTGARGLRRIIENVLLNPMFETPGTDVAFVVVTGEHLNKPLYFTSEQVELVAQYLDIEESFDSSSEGVGSTGSNNSNDGSSGSGSGMDDECDVRKNVVENSG